jgi:hypothetical protein
MASIINAATTDGLIQTADTSGILQLQTAGVTGITIDASQNVTFAKGLTVGATAAPAFSAYQSTGQSLSVTWTKVQCNTELFDTASAFSAGIVVTNTDVTNRFTPQVAGYYQINGQIQSNITTLGLMVSFYKNGASAVSGAYISVSSGTPSVNVSGLVYLNGSTDYVELFGYSGTTGTLSNASFSAFLARSA